MRPSSETRLNGSAPHRQGQGARHLRPGDALLIVATDRISAFDYVLGSGIPDKGKVLTQLSAFWFARRAHRRQPCDLKPTPIALSRRTCAATPTSCRPIDARPQDQPDPDRVRRARLPRRARLEGLSATGASAASACPPGCANPTGCPSRSSRRPPRPRPATTSTSARPRPAASSAPSLVDRSSADAGALRVRRGARRARGIIWPTRSSSSALTPEGDVMLIDEAMTPDSSRYWPKDQYAPGRRSRASTSSSSATTSNRSAGTSSRPCPRCRMTWSAKTREKYVEAFRRLTGRELD